MAATTEERLERVDREVEDLKRSFVEAIQHLQVTPEVDASFDHRLSSVSARFRQLRTELQPEDFDKAQLDELWRAVVDIPDLLEATPNLEACDQMLIRIERVRHVVRDAIDEHVAGIAGDTAAVMNDLGRWLPTTTREKLAELLGVERRTLSRWQKLTGRAAPPRLRAVARIVAILRHSWTEQGIVAWFHRPRRELGGVTPLEVLADDNFDEQALMSAARSGRSQYGA
jgi:hypothetical protein